MNLLEFKRRLMTEPGSQDTQMRELRRSGGEAAAAAAESDHFEAALKRALHVPVPHGLAEQIILRQSLDNERPSGVFGGRWPQLTAMAAALALAVALTTFNLVERQPASVDVGQHIAWHWQHDGPEALATASGSTAPNPTQVQRVFAEFGLQIEPELLEKVRMTKVCPTPDGAGAHVVLSTDEGPVTVYYMPRTRLPSSPQTITLPDGAESFMVNLERGSMALISESGANTPELAREIAKQLSFAPGVTI
ncbi:MAG: DUF3379 family protein [Wenzhouxiangellaceae bacterium]|nr:DUF3379 family protein [Wenzhouxiangellaceae bacterium]